MTYYLNEVMVCTLNTLGLLSIERTRKTNHKNDHDATAFAQEGSDLFSEK
jgi:hypothetical protein